MFRLAAAIIMFVSTVLGAGSVLAQQRLSTIRQTSTLPIRKKQRRSSWLFARCPCSDPSNP